MYENFYATILDEEPVLFGGRAFTLWWTAHARQRTSMRGAMGTGLADVFLRGSLQRAEQSISQELSALTDSCTVYDKIFNIFAALALDREQEKIFAVSYGDATEMYPRYDEMTIQTNKNGNVRLIKWKAQRETPIETNIIFRLNGKKLKVRLTKWSTKIVQDRKNCSVRMKKIREITAALSAFSEVFPEHEIVNIWDWRTGAFLSANIPDRGGTFDVILFKNVDFVANNQYIRIDITEKECTIQRPYSIA